MKFDLSSIDWRALAREPIGLGLLLSVCLHLAAALVLQPVPGSGIARTVVISARLETAAAREDPAPPAETPAPTDTPAEPDKTLDTQALLTIDKPSPAPPLPASVTPEPNKPAAPVATRTAESTTPADPAPANSTRATAPTDLIGVPLGYDPTWYLARQVDTHPRAMGRIDPKYPEDARRRNLEGSVKLMLKIDDLGRVKDAEVVESTPPGVFDEAALEAFSQARFRPAMRDGRPVRYQAYFRVEFKLD